MRLKKVKMFLVETLNLLNLVIYVRNVHSKNTEAMSPVYYYKNLYSYTAILLFQMIHVFVEKMNSGQ